MILIHSLVSGIFSPNCKKYRSVPNIITEMIQLYTYFLFSPPKNSGRKFTRYNSRVARVIPVYSHFI